MKMKLLLAVSAATAITLAGCTEPEVEQPSAEAIAADRETNAQAMEEVQALMDEIDSTDDPDELLAILTENGMFSETGRAAEAKLREVLEPQFAAADSEYDLYQLKKYTGVRGSTIFRMYDARAAELQE